MAIAVAVSGACGAAQAAVPRVRFHIEPKRLSEALLDLAQQANVTLIGAGACDGAVSRTTLSGALTVQQALDQLLSGAPCAWKMIAPDAVEIRDLARNAAAPASPPAVSELLVTATKRVRDPRQLAVSMTAVSGQDLQATGASDAAEGAAQLDILSTNLGPGRDKLLLRGLSDGAYTGRARSTVATYLDDLPINYNAPDPDLRLVDVERVEIARGPQSTLFGAGFLSGLYRIVSRKPDLGRFSTELRATGSLTESGGPSGAVEGYVNLPVWRDTVGVRLSAYDELDGGYLNDIVLKKDDANRTERRGVRSIFLLQPQSDWSVEMTIAAQHLRSNDTQYTTPGLGLNRDNRIAEPHVNDIGLATVSVRKSWGWGDFTSTSGFVRHEYASFYDATAVQDLYTSHAQTSAYSEKARVTMFVEDAFLTSRGAGPFQWLAGVYGSDTEEHSPTEFLAQLSFVPQGVPVYGDDRRDRINEIAAYGEASWAFAPRWLAAVGGRAFDIHTHTTSSVVSERFDPRSLDRDVTFKGFAPKLSVQRELSAGDLIYAVMSEGLRTGGVNSGGAVPLAPQQETFGPDRLTNYEAGLKMRFWHDRVALNSAVFYDVWKNIQTDQFRPSGIPFTTNAGDAGILGLEAEAQIQISDSLSAQFNGRLDRTRITNANPIFTSAIVNGLPDAPAVSGGGVLTYQRALRGDWKLRLVGETTYVGRSRVNFDTRFPEMGGYVRTKLLVEIRRKAVGLQVFLTNPTNAFNDTFAFGNPFNPTQIQQVTPQRPRTLGITLFASH
ncbi:MAG TPA: TonB-dependent receptor [Phenylobacterium sp.]|jgi:iron complex outermembrane receptor protein|uniref:TonB-dependent receptor n=1 Tax=Phenylobacterium sp. TaxID=1871053 RepID=UPI002CF8AE8C|nr:TonB-dependent receptor [Phenylobacterium sp.]HXA39857.1 TonB-dependent receptor [Phenylobacterium sp.]